MRSVDTINDKQRVKEFYLMTPEDAYELLRDIALISGTMERLHLHIPTNEEIMEEKIAEKNRELVKNRHHFKDIKFSSSLTKKEYYSKTKDDGTLGIYEVDSDIEIPNNSNPSKKQILLQAVKDYGEEVDDNNITLYQLQHKLEKLVINK